MEEGTLSEDVLTQYDSYTEKEKTYTALINKSGTFTENVDNYISVQRNQLNYKCDVSGTAADLLCTFYSSCDSPDFSLYTEKMCSYDKNCGYTPLTYLWFNACQDNEWENIEETVSEILPFYGDWCNLPVNIMDSDGEETSTTALIAIIGKWCMFNSDEMNMHLSAETINTLLDIVEKHNLLCGTQNRKLFTGDWDHDVPLAERLINEGRITEDEAVSMRLSASNELLEQISDLDEYLEKITYIDRTYGQIPNSKIVNFYDDTSLLTDNLIPDFCWRSPDDSANENANGRKALFAVLPRDENSIIITPSAYIVMKDSDEKLYRIIPEENTPDSVSDADIIIVPFLEYSYYGTYSDGTTGYKCCAKVYAFEIDTGRCVSYIGSVTSNPEKTLSANTKYDVYPLPDTMELCELVSTWLRTTDS